MAISQLLVGGFCFNMGHFEGYGPTVPPLSIEPHFRPSITGKTGPRNFFGTPRTTWNRPILSMDGGTSRTLSSRCFSGPDSGMAPSSPSVRPRPSCDKGPWMGQSIERRARCGAVWSGQVSTHAGSDEGGAAIQSSSVVLRGLPDITSTQKGKGVRNIPQI